MSGQENILEKKKLGRPAIGKGVQINAMHRPEDVAALDAWIESQPQPRPTRPEAVRVAVREWLADRQPVTPATIGHEIQALEHDLAAIPAVTEQSPEAALQTMDRALAENELAELRYKRKHIRKAKPT